MKRVACRENEYCIYDLPVDITRLIVSFITEGALFKLCQSSKKTRRFILSQVDLYQLINESKSYTRDPIKVFDKKSIFGPFNKWYETKYRSLLNNGDVSTHKDVMLFNEIALKLRKFSYLETRFERDCFSDLVALRFDANDAIVTNLRIKDDRSSSSERDEELPIGKYDTGCFIIQFEPETKKVIGVCECDDVGGIFRKYLLGTCEIISAEKNKCVALCHSNIFHEVHNIHGDLFSKSGILDTLSRTLRYNDLFRELQPLFIEPLKKELRQLEAESVCQ